MSPCPQCGVTLESPLGCSACGALLDPDGSTTPWALFGIDVAYAVDAAALRKSLRRISRQVHPDFHGAPGPDGVDLRELAERNTARLNEAYEVLRDDYARADHLVRMLGGPDEKAERQMPQAFLMEVLEWSEALDEARGTEPGSAARAALQPLADELRARQEASLGELRELLQDVPEPNSPQLVQVRKVLNALRYLDRTLADIKELRLEQAAR